MRKQRRAMRKNRNKWLLLGTVALIAIAGVTVFFLFYGNGTVSPKTGISTSSSTRSSLKTVQKSSQKAGVEKNSTAAADESASNDSSPALHLTWQQFESWVRLTVKQASQVYTPQNYRFEPFVTNGLVALKAYYNMSPDVQYGVTNASQLVEQPSASQHHPDDFEYNGTYRINQYGQLEYCGKGELEYKPVPNSDDSLQTVLSEK